MPTKSSDLRQSSRRKAALPGQFIENLYNKNIVDRVFEHYSISGEKLVDLNLTHDDIGQLPLANIPNIPGSKLTSLATTPAGSGEFPIANIPDIPGDKLTDLDLIAPGAGVIPEANLPDTVTGISTISWFVGLSGISANQFAVTGELREIANTQAGDYTTDFAVGNQHVYLFVDAITTGGAIVVTGTSLSESTAIPVAGDTETITVDTTEDQYYQTSKKWLEITNIDVSATTGIDYDIGIVGYIDMGNRNFTIEGFRAEFRTSSNSADIRLRIRKVQDDGSGKMSIVTVESIGFDSTPGNGEVYDTVRTGGNDRSYTAGSNIAPSGSMFVFKQLDFSTYFSSDENILEGADKDEGLIVDFQGEPSGGISSVDFGTVTLYYTFD